MISQNRAVLSFKDTRHTDEGEGSCPSPIETQEHIEVCHAFSHLRHGKDIELVFEDKVTYFMELMLERNMYVSGFRREPYCTLQPGVVHGPDNIATTSFIPAYCKTHQMNETWLSFKMSSTTTWQ